MAVTGADRFKSLKAAASSTASTVRVEADTVLRKLSADDGLMRHKTELSQDFGKVRMHNSRRRSYIQIVLPGNGKAEVSDGQVSRWMKVKETRRCQAAMFLFCVLGQLLLGFGTTILD